MNVNVTDSFTVAKKNHIYEQRAPPTVYLLKWQRPNFYHCNTRFS